MLNKEKIIEILLDKFSDSNIILNDKYIEINIEKNILLSVIKDLKEDSLLQYNQLIDLTAIDYPSREKRFELVYLLLSMTQIVEF